jgi:hypothetical protein
MAVKKIFRQRLFPLIILCLLILQGYDLQAGTGSARDGDLFVLLLTGCLTLLAGLLHLKEYLLKKIRQYLEAIISLNEYHVS